jgi:putative ABC transport system substrate-binding protein
MELYRLTRTMVAGVLMLLPGGLACASDSLEVTVVVDEASATHMELVAAAREQLDTRNGDGPGIQLGILDVSQFHSALQGPLSGQDLLVAVGTRATREVATVDSAVPLLSVLIPRIAYEQIHAERLTNSAFSAIFLDQPMERRFELVRRVVPGAKHVGVLLSDSTLPYQAELQQVALDSAMQLEVESVREEDRVVPLLDRLLRRSDAMLAIVDLLVFNRANVRNVLLTAYRHRVPVFGVSESYAKAGCVAAVYSKPGHIGVQLAEEILAYATDGDAGLPTPQFPRYFSVAYNSRVARSLDLSLEKLEGFGKQPETSSGVEQ